MRPEEVAAEARRRAEERGYEDLSGFEVETVERPSLERIRRWSFIEVDPAEVVYSTRKLGAPITAVKRALTRLLAQYNNELTSQVTRFNVHLLAYVHELERRVSELEEQLGSNAETDEEPAEPDDHTTTPPHGDELVSPEGPPPGPTVEPEEDEE